MLNSVLIYIVLNVRLGEGYVYMFYFKFLLKLYLYCRISCRNIFERDYYVNIEKVRLLREKCYMIIFYKYIF